MTLGFEAKTMAVGDIDIVGIDDVQEHPMNPRKHRVELIARALMDYGQRTPIVAQQSTKLILKGNGTWKAAKLLGWSEIAVIWSDLEGDAAVAYMLSDNRPSDLATYDRKKLRDGLAQMIAGPGLNVTLWGEEEFEDLDEEFRGMLTLPAQATVDEGDGPTEAAATAKPVADPTKKMREVPFVFTAVEHAQFMEWLSQLKSAFGTNDWKATVYEAIRRQAMWESDGVNQKGKVPEPVVEGQVGLDEVIDEAQAVEIAAQAEVAKDEWPF